MSASNERRPSEDPNLRNSLAEAEAIEAKTFATELRLKAYEQSVEASQLELEAARMTLLATQARVKADQTVYDCLEAEREAARLAEQASYVPEEGQLEEQEERLFRVVVDAGLCAVDVSRAIADIFQRTEVADRRRLIRLPEVEDDEDLRLQAEVADRTRMSGRPGGVDPEASVFDQYSRIFRQNLASNMLMYADELARGNEGENEHGRYPNGWNVQDNLVQAISQIADLWIEFLSRPVLQELELPEAPQGFENLEEVHEFVNGLPRPRLAKLEEDDRRCHICFDPFTTDGPAEGITQGDQIDQENPEIPLRTNCRHIVGSHCLLMLLSPLVTSACPHCRAPLRNTSFTEIESNPV